MRQSTEPDEREAELQAVFSAIDEGFCICQIVLDDDGRAIDYRFIEVNPLFEEMTGLVDAAGRTAMDLVPGLEQVWVDTYAQVALERRTLRFEQGSDVMGRWFDVFAMPLTRPGRFAIVFKDITSRRAAENALRAAAALDAYRARLADALQAAPDRTAIERSGCAALRDHLGAADVRLTGDLAAMVAHLPAAGAGKLVAQVRSGGVGRGPDLLAVPLPALGGEAGATADRAAPGRPDHPDRPDRPDRVSGRTPARTDPRVLAVRSAGPHTWTPDDVTAAKETATRIHAALETAFAEAALRSTAVLNAFRAELGDAVRGVADPGEVQAVAARVLGQYLEVARVQFAEISGDGRFETPGPGFDAGMPLLTHRVRLDDHGPEVMAAFRRGAPVVVDDVTSDERLDAEQRAATLGFGVGSYVMAPQRRGETPVAALMVHREDPHRWSTDELTLVEETMARTWAVVQQVRSEQVQALRRARAEATAELLAGLEQLRTVEAQLAALCAALVPDLGDFACVHEGGGRRRTAAGATPGADYGGAIRLAARGEAVLQEVADGDGRSDPTSVIAVPLTVHGEVPLVVVVGRTTTTAPAHSAEDLEFAVESARRAAVVLAATRLREEEHEIAVRLQRALLPDEIGWHPNVVIEGRYQAAAELLDVGGDWYDTFTWPDGRMGLIVGDVVGHTLESAAAMGRLRAATAALATSTPPSPAALLDAVEGFAAGRDGVDFVTAVTVVVDPATGLLRYSSAGHPPGVVVAPDGRISWLDDARWLPISGPPRGPRPEAEVQLEPGTLVVLYTDGLVERRGETLTDGLARLGRAVADVAHLPIAEATDALLAAMSTGTRPVDDVVLLCFRWTPPVARLELTVPATADRLREVRAGLGAWLAHHDVGAAQRDGSVLAVGEACTNVVEHAYRDGEPGDLSVEITHHGGHLVAVVGDRGTWRTRDPRGAGGHGVTVMRNLADRYTTARDPGGTTVTLVLPTGTGHGPRSAAPVDLHTSGAIMGETGPDAPERPGAEPDEGEPVIEPSGPAEVAATRGDDGNVRVTLRGDVDYANAEDVRRGLETAVAGASDVTLDLTGLGYCDSQFLRVLDHLVRDRGSDAGLTLVVRPGAPVGALLRLTALDLVVPVIEQHHD